MAYVRMKNTQHVKCITMPISDKTSKLYTQKDLVLIYTWIKEFCKKLYIPAIQKLAFYLPHVRILGTHYCVKEHYDVSKRRGELHGVLC